MAENKKAEAGIFLGAGAAIASAVALARSHRTAKASPGDSGDFALDNAAMALLEAIAAGTGATLEEVQSIEAAIQGGSPGGPTPENILGILPNADLFVAGRRQVSALNTAVRLPELAIPNGFEIQFKGWPTNAGIIYVACTDPAAKNLNSVWPLLANEAVGYAIKNLNNVYFSGSAVGDWLAWTVEQRK